MRLSQEFVVRVKRLEDVPASTTRPPDDDEKRRTLISEAALLVGTSWARLWRDALRGEGRRVDGGWPGTRSESKVKVRHHLDGMLAKLGLAPLDRIEIERATATAYDRAKADWLSFTKSRKASRRKARPTHVEEN